MTSLYEHDMQNVLRPSPHIDDEDPLLLQDTARITKLCISK